MLVACRRRLALCTVFALGGCDQVFQLDRPDDVVGFVAFVQANAELPTGTPIVAVKYLAAQTAGNLNVVAVGWANVATIVSVADQNGEYTLAVAPMMQGSIRQAIYYRGDIAAAEAAANVVTVTFSEEARYPDVRVAEYSGIDPSDPFDVGTGSVGAGTSMTSGNAVTNQPHTLLVGASFVDGMTITAGAGFTTRILTANGDLLEDQEVFETGPHAATATQDRDVGWVMQLAAFRGF